MTEAKTAALQRLAAPSCYSTDLATGTGTDQYCVAAPLEGPRTLDIYTPYFETLTGDQEIAAGMHLFETPGHTAGHYSLMVELPGRRSSSIPPLVVLPSLVLRRHGRDAGRVACTREGRPLRHAPRRVWPQA